MEYTFSYDFACKFLCRRPATQGQPMPAEHQNLAAGPKSRACGGKLPAGVCKRVEALQFFHVFKIILIVSYRRDEVLIWLIFPLFGNLSDNN